MAGNDYAPQAPRRARLHPDERHLHSFRLRGYRYALAEPEPRHEDYVAHLTQRRLVLEPLDEREDVVALPWNDLIEFRLAAGTRLVDEVPGVEDHMLLLEGASTDARRFADMFVFTVEPVSGAAQAQRPGHCAAFLEIVEDLLLEAFEE